MVVEEWWFGAVLPPHDLSTLQLLWGPWISLYTTMLQSKIRSCERPIGSYRKQVITAKDGVRGIFTIAFCYCLQHRQWWFSSAFKWYQFLIWNHVFILSLVLTRYFIPKHCPEITLFIDRLKAWTTYNPRPSYCHHRFALYAICMKSSSL